MVSEEWTKKEVESYCEEHKIKLTIVEQESDKYKAGTVMRQSRAAGDIVVEGSNLKVTIAVAPQKTTTDDTTTDTDDSTNTN